MRYQTQPGGFYGTGLGNNMAFPGPGQMSTDVIQANIPGARLAGNPSFDINRGSGALGGRSEEQIRRLQKSVPDNQQLLEEMRRRGITPGGGPQLPMAYGGGGMAPMGNAGAMAAGFHNVTVS
jgi:hypothetical protein